MKYLKKSLMIIISLCILFVLYVEIGSKFRLNNEDKRTITWHIRSSKKLPHNFTNFYNTVYLNALSKNSWNFYIQQLISSRNTSKACPCHAMGNRLMPTLNINNKLSLDYFLIIRYIEQNYSQEDCLNFNFSNFDFLYGRKGIEQVSQSLFNKETKDLKPMEMAEILTLYENPVRNNRNRNPERSKERTLYLYNRYLINVNK